MNLTIRYENKEYMLNLLPFSQLCGENMIAKENIVNALHNYFGTGKILSQKNCEILSEGHEVGKKYFTVSLIREREDIIKEISMTKTSMMMKYFETQISDFSANVELEKIALHMEKIYKGINSKVATSLGGIAFGYKMNDLVNMLQKTVVMLDDDRELNEIGNWELLMVYLNLQKELQKDDGEKRLIILKNIETLLTAREYKEFCVFIKRYIKETSVWIILSIILNEYVDFSVEYFHGINVVNDGVFCFPTKERLEEFLEKNYPSNLFRNKNVDKLMCEIVHKIGKSNNSILFDSFVILKLLNKTLCINQGEISGLNGMEYEFLHDSDF